ncbi:DUF4595 domain-containing protein [Alistipes shahii]|jgi:hypothetical protein|uniref:DUF4595 domain-containing protein n=1 Tax=Bacteroidales TaxID=171549 RepID=UPI0026DB50AD|nr:DUF4595 domain-containing protein [Alistipes shahii]
MKKLFFIVAAMFVAVSFSACSDDDDNGGKAPTPEKWVKQIVFRAEWDESWTTSITYDSEKRVKKVDGLRNDSYEFTYNGNSLTVKGSDRTYTCKLNSDGYVTEVTENDFDKDETYYYKMEYKNGYLQRVEQRYSYNESRVRVSECTWRDGNLVESKCTDYNEDGTDITTVKYSYSQTATPINIDLFYIDGGYIDVLEPLDLLGFYGRQSAKLPNKANITYSGESESESDDFGVYTLNDDGTVARIDCGSVSYELIY